MIERYVENTREFAGVIYGLHNGDYDFRYIGQTTTRLKRRFDRHLCDSRKGFNRPLYDWMRKYGEENIHVCVIETFDEDTIHLIDEREVFHIAQARAYNGKNLNLNDGGGSGKGWVPTDEQRARMSAAGRGRPVTEETRKKIASAQRGRVLTADHKAKISASRVNMVMSDETRLKISASKLGVSTGTGMGQHTRWHANRGVTKSGCRHCATV